MRQTNDIQYLCQAAIRNLLIPLVSVKPEQIFISDDHGVRTRPCLIISVTGLEELSLGVRPGGNLSSGVFKVNAQITLEQKGKLTGEADSARAFEEIWNALHHEGTPLHERLTAASALPWLCHGAIVTGQDAEGVLAEEKVWRKTIDLRLWAQARPAAQVDNGE